MSGWVVGEWVGGSVSEWVSEWVGGWVSDGWVQCRWVCSLGPKQTRPW